MYSVETKGVRLKTDYSYKTISRKMIKNARDSCRGCAAGIFFFLAIFLWMRYN